MNEPTESKALTPLQQAEFAACRFAALPYRGYSAWSVTLRTACGVRSLFKDLTSQLAQAVAIEQTDKPIRESIHVMPESGFIQFTAEEAYLIAQSLQSDVPISE